MSEADNRRIVEEAIAALNAHDIDRYLKCHANSYVWEFDAFPTPVRGLEAVRQIVAGYFKAFPDMHFEIDQIIASGDYVVGRWRCTATHKGEFNGIAPTNRQVSIRGCTVSEIKNDQFVKSAAYSDQLALMQQLGAVAKAAGA
jgi:steroid delta-isomerase-like uncharacterized protein